jgi:hypothetical protein
MKKSWAVFSLAAGLLWLSGPVAAMAAIVDPGAPPASTGVPYSWGVTMGSSDTTVGSTTFYGGTTPGFRVGSHSWNDPINAGDPIGTGWTHTSNWTALTLTEAAHLSVTLEATVESPGLVPAFSLYSGQQLTDNGSAGGWHVYNNAGNFDWSSADPTYDSSSLNYIGNEANLGGLSSISKVFFSLAAGDYTLVYGGNPPEGTPVGPVGYQATLTTSPVPVPAAVWLFGSGLAGVVAFARRRMSA